MATGWVKSLHCMSNALDDVACPSTTKKQPLLHLATSCANSSHALKDVVFLSPRYPSTSSANAAASASLLTKRTKSRPGPKSKSKSKPKPKLATPSSSPAPVRLSHSNPFSTLAELPAGHSSRRVLEIIFSSSWSGGGCGGRGGGAFPGVVEMLFRVHNPARTIARFEEYRALVRSRAARSDDARCAADGNEMMRFHCGGAAAAAAAGADAIYDASVACCAVWSRGGKVGGIRTFAGSGGAHESGGGGAGRRAMLVCRVVAGRVRGESEDEWGSDSVSLGKGELVVFDPRAVLPCFLIIYKV